VTADRTRTNRNSVTLIGRAGRKINRREVGTGAGKAPRAAHGAPADRDALVRGVVRSSF
jgi:hypothetical protein